MIKTLAIANKSERVRVRVPHSVQQSIPIRRIYTNGIWEVGRKHSRSWRLTDVNYIAASDEPQHNIFKSYCAALNSLPTDVTAKITIVNHRLNPAEFERRILLPYKDDWLDHYREEANAIMLGRAAQSNNLVQERFVTLSIPQRKISESRAYFRRAGANLQKTFARLDSGITPANNYDRLRILHDFFRPGYEQYFDYDDYLYMQSGKDFRDLICPDSISFKRNHFEFGNRFGRVLFLRTYASFVTDDLISDLTEYARDLILSIDMIPVPTDEAVKEVESIILGVDTDITRWQQRQNSRNNFTAEVPRTMEQKRENSRGFMDDLTQNDQRMIFSLITLVHTADSLEELDADTESLIAIGKEHLCDISPARFQQEDGLNTALPYGLRRIHALHTLTTESCAVAIPFRAQEIQDPSGLSYGINEVSKNPIVCDRKLLSSPHAFYLGISGSGRVKAADRGEVIRARSQADILSRKNHVKQLFQEASKAESELQRLQGEIIKSLTGESAFTPEMLRPVIESQERKYADLMTAYKEAEADYHDAENNLLAVSEKFDDMLEWAAMYNNADIAAKKMIVSRIIDRVDMYRDYEIKITLNISIEQFLNSIEMVA